MAGISSAISVGIALATQADTDLEEAESIVSGANTTGDAGEPAATDPPTTTDTDDTKLGESGAANMSFEDQTKAQGLVTGAVFTVGQGSEIIKQAGKTADSMTNKMGAKS